MKGLAAILCTLALPGLMFCSTARAANSITAGKLKQDSPTILCLSLRWMISGDDNRNTTVKVWYRVEGEKDWKQGLPLFRIQPKGIAYKRVVPDMFAGSIFDLTPDTRYEIKLKMEDPDGGGTQRIIRDRTRAVPRVPKNAAVIRCTPQNLQVAVQAATPGTIIEVGPGMFKGSLNVIGKKGTQDKPIVIRGAGFEKTILEGNGSEAVVDARRSQYVYLEKLAVRGPAYMCVNCNGAKGFVVRHCHFTAPSNEGHAIWNGDIYSPGSDFYIADNIFIGMRKWGIKYTAGGADPIAVNLNGRGHVVCYNLFRKWNTAVQGSDRLGKIYTFDSTDIYNNDIRFCIASNIEPDCGTHNIRIFRNRFTDVGVSAVSTQPIYGGPCYIFRNVLYNSNYTPFKMHNQPCGVLLFHNTSVRAGPAYLCYAKVPVNNLVMRNNLFLGSSSKTAWESYNKFNDLDIDYDGFSAGKLMINGLRPPSIKALNGKGPIEKHGVLVDLSIFAAQIQCPTKGTLSGPKHPDLRLKRGCVAVDVGEVLPNINDDYKGKAPDLGAYEEGDPLPHYGPRPEGKDETNF